MLKDSHSILPDIIKLPKRPLNTTLHRFTCTLTEPDLNVITSSSTKASHLLDNSKSNPPPSIYCFSHNLRRSSQVL